MGALKWEGSGRVSGELDGRWLTFLQKLVNVISVDFESMVVVERHNNESDVLTLLNGDHTRFIFIFLRRHPNFFHAVPRVCLGTRILCESGPHGVT
jgi:hypothetical protein